MKKANSEIKTQPKKKVRKKTVKKTVKKDSTRVKKTVLKNAAKKTIKRPAKTSVKKKVLKTKSSTRTGSAKKKKTDNLTTEVVDLPKNVSASAVQKAVILRTNLSEYTHKCVYVVAYVSAVCFILVGGIVAFSEVLGNDKTSGQFKAEVIEGSSNDDEEPIYPAEVDFISDIPDNVEPEFEVKFVAKHVSNFNVFLKPLDPAGHIELPFDQIFTDKYKSTIPLGLQPGYYQFKVAYIPFDETGYSALVSESFFIGNEDQELFYNNPDTEIDEDEKNFGSDLSDDTREEDSSSNSESSNSSAKNTGSDDSEAEEESTNIDTRDEFDLEVEQDEDAEIIDDPDEIEQGDSHLEESYIAPEFKILELRNSEVSGTVSLQVIAPSNLDYIELYARPLTSLENLFVALAHKAHEDWLFVVNTKDIPNGHYEFFAKTKHDAQQLISEAVKFEIRNEDVVVSETEKENTIFHNFLTDETTRDFIEYDVNDFEPQITTEENVTVATEELLHKNSDELDDLLNKYATALQSGDETIIALAKENLDSKREEIVFDTLYDTNLKDISDNIDKEMSNEIDILLERIETFEDLRKERSKGMTSVDSDGDGVSDFDEIKLYNTNPNLADSDNDGFNDGIEIVKGFNPNDSKQEAIIIFESPKEMKGLIQTEILQIQSVTPVTEINTSVNSRPKTKAEIRGKGLPNSFVTLYIYSTPTVVTIKTDSDGSFVYTFDKELEDGRHDVYVAVTDNTGSIIAQSNAFSFVKEAQAFSPIDSDEKATVVSGVHFNDSSNTLNIVIGLAVLSLGIILLMLGVGLRAKEPIIISEQESDSGSESVVFKDEVSTGSVSNKESSA